MLDRIKETPIHQLHLGIFFPKLISWSWSPEETKNFQCPWTSVTYAHFLTLHWKVLSAMCSVRAPLRFSFKWNQDWPQQLAETQVTQRSWGSWGSATGEQGYWLRMEPVQLGTWHLAALELQLHPVGQEAEKDIHLFKIIHIRGKKGDTLISICKRLLAIFELSHSNL